MTAEQSMNWWVPRMLFLASCIASGVIGFKVLGPIVVGWLS